MSTVEEIRKELSDVETLKFMSEALLEISALRIKSFKSEFERNRSFFDEMSDLYDLVKVSASKHDFVIPVDEGESPDIIFFDESHWDSMISDNQYIAKKQADQISFAWDKLIEHFVANAGVLNEGEWQEQDKFNIEQAVRVMASESRFRRRQLAFAFIDILEKTPKDMRNVRVVYSTDFPLVA